MSEDTLTRARRGVHHPDPSIRQESAMRLGTLADASMAAELVSLLVSEDDFFVRETLTWAVVAQSEASFPLLVRALEREGPSRVQVLHALSKIRDPEAVSAIIPLAADADPAVAAKAWWALGRIADPRGLSTLLEHLGDSDRDRRQELTAALAQFGEPAVASLAERLRDTSRSVHYRRHVAEILTAIEDPGARGAVDALIQAVEQDDKEVAVVAIGALAQLRLPKVDEALQRFRDTSEGWLAIMSDWYLTDRAEQPPARRAAAPDHT